MQDRDGKLNLVILYDLAISIGAQATVAEVLASVLERFLYHTGYSVGVMLQRLDWGRLDERPFAPVKLEMAIGDPQLSRAEGTIVNLPAVLAGGKFAAVDDPEVLACFHGRRAFRHAEVLPVAGYGAMVLLAREAPARRLDAKMFLPVLDRLGAAVSLRREREGANKTFDRIFQESVNQSPISIVVMNRDKKIIYCNPAFSIYFGYSLDEAYSLDPARLFVDDEGRQLKLIWDAIDAVGMWKGEGHRRRKDGSQFWSQSTVAPLRDTFGKITHVIAIAEDITKRKEHEQSLKEMVERLDLVLRQTIAAFSAATVHNDPYTAGHEYRVTDLCLVLGRRLGMEDSRLLGLELAARSHDIGQIRVPAEILLRPSALSDLEYEFVKQHVEAGWDILKAIDFPWAVAEIVRQHHENFDGTGYPRGLAGDDLLLEARILRVADSAEAMSSHRPFRSAFPRDQVIRELQALSGTAFDQQVVDACVEILEEGYQFPPPPR